MGIRAESKLNQLMQNTPQGAVILSSWLKFEGYSHSLQHRYMKSGWLESIGTGALKRKNDDVIVFGAIYALQYQNNKDVHFGGISALGLLGFAHYLKLNDSSHTFFAKTGFQFPEWFKKNQKWRGYQLFCTSFLPPHLGIMEYDYGSFKVKISNPARAIMECLEVAPKNFDLSEAYLVMEGLTSLKPAEVQGLLESCTSIKVKRLFLYFAEMSNHSWFSYLDLSKINLGTGKRAIAKNGIYNSNYKITVPQIMNEWI